MDGKIWPTNRSCALSFCTEALKKSFDNLAEGSFDKLVSHVMLTRTFWQMLCCIMSPWILHGLAATNVRGIAFDVNSYTLTSQCCLLNQVSPVWCWRFHWFMLSFWINLFWKTCHQIAISLNYVRGSIYQHETYQCYLSRWLLLLHCFCLIPYCLLCMLWFHHDLRVVHPYYQFISRSMVS